MKILFSLLRYKHPLARATEVSVRKSFIMLVGAFNPFIHLHTMMMTSVFLHPPDGAHRLTAPSC
jgi:hypothetical protein